MSRNRSIAQRMGNELSGAKKGDPNYAKVLFTPDDMASFETLPNQGCYYDGHDPQFSLEDSHVMAGDFSPI